MNPQRHIHPGSRLFVDWKRWVDEYQRRGRITASTKVEVTEFVDLGRMVQVTVEYRSAQPGNNRTGVSVWSFMIPNVPGRLARLNAMTSVLTYQWESGNPDSEVDPGRNGHLAASNALSWVKTPLH